MADIFNTTTTEGTTTNVATEPNNSTDSSFLNQVVGEGKKYANVEELAKGSLNGDQFITQLQEEGAGLRVELDKRLNAEDMVQQIKREREEALAASATTQENTTSQLDEGSLTKLISTVLDNKSSQEVATANLQTADAKMKEHYGADKAQEVMQAKANELHMSIKDVTDLAAKSPSAFFNVMGISGTKDQTVPTTSQSTVNTSAMTEMNTSNVQQGTDKYYSALRKANPSKYFTPKIQNQLFKDRVEKGQAFYS